MIWIINSPGSIWTIWQHLAPLWWPITSLSVLLSTLRSLAFHFCQPPPHAPDLHPHHVGLRHRETIHHQFTAITTRPPVGHLSEPGDRFPSILPKWQLYSLVRDCPSVDQWDGGKSLPGPGGKTKGYIWLINEDVAQRVVGCVLGEYAR